MNKPIVLLDIDNTILDSDSTKVPVSQIVDDNYGSGASVKFWQVYEQVREELGYVDSKEVAMRFAKVMNSPDYASAVAAFVDLPFEKFLLPYAKELIDFLGEHSRLVIFSDGDDLFQKTKAQKLGLYQKAHEVIIAKSKKNMFPELFRRFADGAFIVIDDKPEILELAKKFLPNCKTVWFKFGKYALESPAVKVDFETNKLSAVKEYIQRLIGNETN